MLNLINVVIGYIESISANEIVFLAFWKVKCFMAFLNSNKDERTYSPEMFYALNTIFQNTETCFVKTGRMMYRLPMFCVSIL